MNGRAALAGTAAATVLLVAAVASGDTPAVSVGDWRELPPPPLSPREFPTGFWTGEEVVLVGGSDAPPCPPSASCAAPKTPPLADGAAYDPDTGKWRSIRDAPIAFAWAQPIVRGSTAYLWVSGEAYRSQAPSAFLAYRIEEDRWDELVLPTDEPDSYALLTAGDQIVASSWGDEPHELPDFVFDPGSESWSELPDDPFSPGFDRVMRWSGSELLLFDHELVANPPGDLPLRGAALDLASGEWRVLEAPDAAFAESGGTASDLPMPPVELAEFSDGNTTSVAVSADLFLFLGTSWEEGDQDGEFFGKLHSQAWLWSARA